MVEVYGLTAHEDFDHFVFSERLPPGPMHYIASTLKAYVFFARALWRYDIFHYFFDGGLLRLTPLAGLEFWFLRPAASASCYFRTEVTRSSMTTSPISAGATVDDRLRVRTVTARW